MIYYYVLYYSILYLQHSIVYYKKMNCVIYKISCKDVNIEDCYIGSTCDVRQRMLGHKSDCNNQNNKRYNFMVYKFIRANGGWNNWVMVQIEPFSCNSKKELETRERYWIELLKGKLN